MGRWKDSGATQESKDAKDDNVKVSVDVLISIDIYQRTGYNIGIGDDYYAEY